MSRGGGQRGKEWADNEKREGREWRNKKGAAALREKMKFPFPGRSLSRVQSFRRRKYRFLWGPGIPIVFADFSLFVGGKEGRKKGKKRREGQKNGDSWFESFVIEWFLLLVHYRLAAGPVASPRS